MLIQVIHKECNLVCLDSPAYLLEEVVEEVKVVRVYLQELGPDILDTDEQLFMGKAEYGFLIVADSFLYIAI